MSEILAILAVALLFVAFAIAQKMRGGPDGCQSCNAANATDCAECGSIARATESGDTSA